MMSTMINTVPIGKFRTEEYGMTRRVGERLKAIDKRLQKALGTKNYAEEYHKHLDFISSSQSKDKLSPLEKKYFSELIADISDLTEYNLVRGNIDTTFKVMHAVIFHLNKREQQMEVRLFGSEGLFFDPTCQKTYLTNALDA